MNICFDDDDDNDEEEFSLIDNPAFKDNHCPAIEIGRGYFREKITSNVNDLKFLLLVEDSDLRNGRGQQFRDTIRHFSNFIGLLDQDFDDKKVGNLSDSIGIIINKVDNRRTIIFKI